MSALCHRAQIALRLNDGGIYRSLNGPRIFEGDIVLMPYNADLLPGIDAGRVGIVEALRQVLVKLSDNFKAGLFSDFVVFSEPFFTGDLNPSRVQPLFFTCLEYTNKHPVEQAQAIINAVSRSEEYERFIKMQQDIPLEPPSPKLDLSKIV